MAWLYGADHDLGRLITTHLFIMCPNNSGSTFLKNALATSRRTWNLEKEGQHTFGFAGPSTRGEGAGLIWASNQQWIDVFSNAMAYEWPVTRKAWYFQAFARAANARVFVTKSPPFLLNVHLLLRHFQNARFIFMVRDPYAVVEGITRRRGRHVIPPDVDLFVVAATHIMKCFQYQRHNAETYTERGVPFTYEEMCDRPERVGRLIQGLVPELDDLVLRQRVPVKKTYDEVLRNMNAQQISRLTASDLGRINEVFQQHQDLLDYFHYPLRMSR